MKRALLAILLTGCTGNFHAENDIFAPSSHSDKYYTHGTKFGVSETTPEKKTSYSLGQNIYTPGRKLGNDIPSDRPYTGWLYGEYREISQVSDTVQNVFALQLGCTGRCSQAKETQSYIHKLLDQRIPSWNKDYSLKSEPSIVVELGRRKEMYARSDLDLTGYTDLKVGNLVDTGAVGVNLRYGHGLDQYTPDEVVVRKLVTPKPIDPWHYYIFTKAEGRYVAHNAFLEGSLFQDERHTVTPRRQIGEFQVGLSIGWKNTHVTYAYILMSPEWREQPSWFPFGGIDIAW